MKPGTVQILLDKIINQRQSDNRYVPVGVWFSNGSKQFQVCRYFSDYKIFQENFNTASLTGIMFSEKRNEITFCAKSYPLAVFDLDKFDEAMLRFGTVLDEDPGKIICS